MPPGSQESPSLLPPGLKALKHVPGRHWFGAYRNVVVCYWMQVFTPEEIRELRTTYHAIARESKTPVSLLHYAEQGAGLPVAQSRIEIVGKGELHSGSLGCVGIVLNGAGFWVSALSSFIVGVRMLQPKDALPLRVTRGLEELRPWFVTEHHRSTGERLDPALLHAWIEQARAAMVGA